MKKRFLAFFMALSMLVSLMPAMVFAEDSSVSGSCGDSVTWSYDESTATLTISGNGEMEDFSYSWYYGYNYPGWSDFALEIEHVVIKTGVTDIGRYAFYKCTSLADIVIPGSVTSIGYSAFEYCESLASVDLPDGLVSIGAWAFGNCTSLTSVVLPDTLTSLGAGVFEKCTSLVSVTLSENLTCIADSTFLECVSLVSIVIPASVTEIEYCAFSGCTSLSSVTGGNENITVSDSAFECCDGLTDENGFMIALNIIFDYDPDYLPSDGEIVIPDGVTRIAQYAFQGYNRYKLKYCLYSVTIPDSVTSIGESAFSGCSSITELNISSSLTDIDDGAFGSCEGLADEEGFIIINNICFGYCGSETDITIPDGVTKVSGLCDWGDIEYITLPESVKSIGLEGFNNAERLTGILIRGDLDLIDEMAFYDMSELLWIVFEGDAPLEISPYYVFNGDIITIFYPADNNTWTEDIMQDYDADITWTAYEAGTSPWTELGQTDYEEAAASATVLTVDGEYEVSLETERESVYFSFTPSSTGYYIFSSDSFYNNIMYVYDDDWNLATKESGKSYSLAMEFTAGETYYIAFKMYTSTNTGSFTFTLETYTPETGKAGDNITYEYNGYSYTMTLSGSGEMYDYDTWDNEAPWMYNGMKYLVVGSGITYIGKYAFYYSYDLIDVELPSTLTGIGEGAFSYCGDLETITIPGNVTEIPDQAFYGSGLTSFTITSGVTSIGEYAFSETNLTSITIPAGVANIGEGAFSFCDSLTGINVASGNAYYTSADGVLFNSDKTTLIAYPGGRTDTSYDIPATVTTIGAGAFSGNKNFTSITVPGTVETIGDEAFYYCSNVTSLTIEEGVKYIGKSAFSFIWSWWSASGIESVVIPEGVVSIGDYAFYHTIGIKYISLPESLTYIGTKAFSTDSCFDLEYEEIVIPANVTYIGMGAFSNNYNLKTITFEGDAPEIVKGEDYIIAEYLCIFDFATATVYYPSDASGWTDEYKELMSFQATLTFVESGAIDLSGFTVSLSITSYTYSGIAKKPSVTVTDSNGSKLTKDTDYTVKYSNNTNAGTATVTVTGTGNYTGAATTTFTIKQKTISSTSSAAKVTLSASSYTYNGTSRKPTPTVKITLNGSSKTLKKNTDYTVSYSNNKNTGTATAIITGTGNYKGTLKKTFTIKAKSISSASVTLKASSKTYTGSSIKCGVKSVKLTLNGSAKTLSSSDYTVTYSSNKKIGTATVKIKGKGNYTGTVTKTFKIIPKKAAISSVKSSSSKKMTVKWSKVSGSVTGYQIRYRVKGTSTWKTKTVSSSKLNITISGLKSGKTYQVQVRAYKAVSGKKYYGSWSGTKTVKIK